MKNIILVLCVSLFLSACGKCSECDKSGSLLGRASFNAWVGTNDSEIAFDKKLSGVEFYRSLDAACDITNYASCTEGQLDVLDGSTVVDTAFNLSETAYFKLKAGDSVSGVTAFAISGFSARADHQSVMFKGKLWVIGGLDREKLNDVWSSSDGITWHQETASAAFSARWDHQSVVFDGKLWVIGGYDGRRLNDVWSSSDGITWDQETASAAFSGRNSYQSVVFDGELWVIGGS